MASPTVYAAIDSPSATTSQSPVVSCSSCEKVPRTSSLPSAESVAVEATASLPHRHEHTTSVNRSYSDLDQKSFLWYAFALCALRTAAQQPINLALVRKQTSSHASTLSTSTILRRIFRDEGRWRGLAQGMGALTLGCALSEVIYLGLFEYSRERVPLPSEMSRDAAAGYISDAACRCVHIPLSIIAYRQMSSSSKPTVPPSSSSSGYGSGSSSGSVGGGRSAASSASTSSATRTSSRVVRKSGYRTFRDVYAERGVRSVFAGYGSTLLVGCQWTAIWWALYGGVKTVMYDAAAPLLAPAPADTTASTTVPHTSITASPSSLPSSSTLSQQMRKRLPAWCLSADDNLIINSVASVTTSAATAFLFNPYLVIRTNLQITPNATLWGVTRALYHSRGFRGYYSGLWLNVSACIVDGALASTSYEYAKLWADVTRMKQPQSSPVRARTVPLESGISDVAEMNPLFA